MYFEPQFRYSRLISRSMRQCIMVAVLFNSLTIFVRDTVILIVGPAANLHNMNVCRYNREG